MAGYPAQPAPGYSYPPQGYAPPPPYPAAPAYPPAPYPQQQPAPPPAPASADDFAEQLIRQHKGLTKAAKEIARLEERAERRAHPAAGQAAPAGPAAPAGYSSYDDWVAGLSYLTDEQLEREFHRYQPGSTYHRALVEESQRREDAEEFADDDGSDVEELLDIYGVHVDDGAAGWVLVSPRTQATSMEELMDSLRQSHPYAMRMKHGKVIKQGRVIHQGTVSKSLRSIEEARANMDRDRRLGRTDAPIVAPPPPPGLSPEMQILFKGISDNNNALIQALFSKQDKGNNLIETIQVVKELMVEPLLKVVESQRTPPGDPNLSLGLAKTMIEGSVTLAKHQNAGGGGAGGAGLVDTIADLVGRFGPLIQQQQPQRPALPAPQDVPPAPGANMSQQVASKIGGALDELIKGRLGVEHLPRFAFRNMDDAGIKHVLSLSAEGFAALVRQVSLQKGLPQQYFQRQDIQYGFLWVYEEITRMAALLDWLEGHGRLAERKAFLEWTSPPTVPWSAQQPLVGDEAFSLFAQAYPEIAQAAIGMDLPPPPEPQQVSMHAAPPQPQQQPVVQPHRQAPPQQPQQRPVVQPPRQAPPVQAAPLRIVKTHDTEEVDYVPADPFASAPPNGNGNGQATPQRAQPAPRRAPSEPDFV